MQSTDDGAALRRVEAARYALLRRLTLAMRHQMVVHLQPIGMLTEVMERRLRQPEPDMDLVGQNMEKVHGFAKAGVGASLDFVTWLAPEPGAQVALDEGVSECVKLLRTHFSFRGFTLKSEVQDAPQTVSRHALRMLLPAVLFGLTDKAQSPADLVVSVRTGDDHLELLVKLAPGTGSEGFPANQPYRLLEWEEVEALAQSEGVVLTRGDGFAKLRWDA
jgi:hypothetical protein